MIAALPIIGVIVDAKGRVVKASRPARVAGLIRRRHLADDAAAALAARARKGRHRVEGPLTVLPAVPGRMPLHIDVRAVPLDGAGYVAVLAEDRSRQHRVEAMRRDFLANVGHELKTPIAAVGLLAEALEAAAEDPARVRGFSARLQQESARLGRLVQDIIELSRLEATGPDEQARLCRVDDVIRAAVDSLQVAADAAGVPVEVDAAGGASVFGDPRVLTMAVQNLLSNAVRVSPAGQPVTVAARATDDIVEITVIDRGPGIPAAELPRVFERFYRTDRARSRDTGGTGLGLAIVKHAADTHGGDVQAISRPGEGSTFTIRLPQADAADATEAEEDTADETDDTPRSRK